MRIGILGPLDVRGDAPADPPVDVPGTRLRALLIRLALDPGRTAGAARLIDDLWHDAPPARADNALQAQVSRLRALLGRDLVESRDGGYRLALDPAAVDAMAFERGAAAGRTALAAGEPARAAELLREALARWRGPALADVAEAEWARPSIVRLDTLRLDATEDQMDAELALDRSTRLVPELERLVADHPLRERLCGQLMRALDAAGRRADALARYERIRALLADRLGADPTPELAEIHLAILRGAPLPRPAAAQRPAPERRTNLPAPLTSLVGRDDAVDGLTALLGDARLVTLTGPGGVGKTRLAAAAGRRLVPVLPDGVWFVPLDAVRTAGDVPRAVLAALGVADGTAARSAAHARDRLIEVCADKRLLLVLDNCEHLLDAVAGAVTELLAAAPAVRALATSREPLAVTGESLFPVPPLPVPPADATAAGASGHAAVRLFAERAAAVRPGFTVDDATAEPVVRICRTLDGLPLAIELAAARLRALTAAQVAGRLDDRVRLLAVGGRSPVERHRTLRAVVDWSWDLLDDAERAVLRRLSVFRGGASPEAAADVCAGGPVAGGDVLDVLTSLVEKSLVTADGEARVRYRLLETVRAYAAERLAEAGEAPDVRAAHTRTMLGLVAHAEPLLRGHEQLRWAEVLEAERDNCSAVLRRAVRDGDPRTALLMTAGLGWFWAMRDHESEVGRWSVAVRDLVDGAPPPDLAEQYAFCVFGAALTAGADSGPRQPNTGVLRDALRAAVAQVGERPWHPVLAFAAPIADVLSGGIDRARDRLAGLARDDEPWVRAAAGTFLGHLAINGGRLDDAADLLRTGYAGFHDAGDRWGMFVALQGRAEIAAARGEHADAVRILEEACGYSDAGVHPRLGAVLRIPLGRARAAAGDRAGGRADLERGIRDAERLGETDDAAEGYVALADLARRDGDLDEAAAQLGRAFAIVGPRAGHEDFHRVRALTLTGLGLLAERRGDLGAAADWYERALRAVAGGLPVPDERTLAGVLVGLASLAAARGDHAHAAALLGAAHTRAAGPAGPDADRTARAARAALGDAAYGTAWDDGAAHARPPGGPAAFLGAPTGPPWP